MTTETNPAPDALCTCGHAYDDHDDDHGYAPAAPCAWLRCDCHAFRTEVRHSREDCGPECEGQTDDGMLCVCSCHGVTP